MRCVARSGPEARAPGRVSLKGFEDAKAVGVDPIDCR